MDSPHDADTKVYLTEFYGEDTANGRYKRCKETDFYQSADERVHITDSAHDADVVVYDKEFLE